jgi:hypothetical protein
VKKILNWFHREYTLVYYYLNGSERTKDNMVLLFWQLQAIPISDKGVRHSMDSRSIHTWLLIISFVLSELSASLKNSLDRLTLAFF